MIKELFNDIFKLKPFDGKTIKDYKRETGFEITRLEVRFLKANLVRIWPSMLLIIAAIIWAVLNR